MGNLAYEPTMSTEERLKGLYADLSEFVWSRVGRLLGFDWDEAIKAAKVWDDDQDIIPTSFNWPTERGILVDPQSAVKVAVPVYRMQYVKASDRTPVTNADSTMAELAGLIYNGLVIPKRVKSSTAMATCYNLHRSTDADIQPTASYSQIFAAVAEHNKFENAGCVGEAFEMAIPYLGGEYKELSGRNIYDACWLAYQEVGKQFFSEFSEQEVEDIIASASLELLAYCGGFGGTADTGFREITLEGKTPVQALTEHQIDFAAKYGDEYSLLLVKILHVGHDVASHVAKVIHDHRINYAPAARDNFDILDELVLEAMADRKVGEMNAAYVRQRLGE